MSLNQRKESWLRELLGQNLRPTATVLAEVPIESWESAERFWIAAHTSDVLTNTCTGGNGATTHGEEARAKLRAHNRRPEVRAAKSAAQRGRKATPEAIAKMVAHQNRPEVRERKRAALRGRSPSPATRAAIAAAWEDPAFRARASEARRGRKASPETRAKLSALRKGRPLPAATLAAALAATRGSKRSPESRARMREAAMRRLAAGGTPSHTGFRHSEETRARLRAAALNASSDTRAKMSAAHTGKRHSLETRAKMSAAHKRHPLESLSASVRISGPLAQPSRKAEAHHRVVAEIGSGRGARPAARQDLVSEP